MDLLTQGLLGSALAISIAKPEEIKKAGLIGLIAGLAADVDFFIRSNSDPLLNLEFHRHFTHSLFFIPVAALIISLLLWPLWRKHLSWKRIFLFSLAGYLLSGLLDASTSYGTRLFWPLSDERISFNIISIIDPIFTLLLLSGVLLTLKKAKQIYTWSFLVLASSYLSLGWWQHQQVELLSHQLAKQRGHDIQQLLVKPTLGNLFLWRSVYLHHNNYYVDAIRLNPVSGRSNIYTGSNIQRFHAGQHDLNLPADSVLQTDIKRFSSFTSDYLALHPQQQNTIIDVRYANLPNSVLPLWGIQFNPEKPDTHASYHLYRDASKQTRQTFLSMLFGS